MGGRNVYVKGIGAVSAAGLNVSGHLETLKSGRSPLARTRRFHTAVNAPAGEVSLTDDELKAAAGIPAEEIVSRTVLLGMAAVGEALDDFRARTGRIDPGRVAFISGTSVGGMDLSEVFWRSNRNDLDGGDVRLLKMHDPGAVTGAMADRLSGKGLGIGFRSTVSTACSAAANAIMLASRMISSGMADAAIAGGTDSLCRFTLNGFNSLRILDSEICRPFDASRAGLNLGEGAGYLILTADPEGALCRISGWGNANEAYHQTASSPEGTGPGMAMEAALKRAGISPSETDFINTHGTGTQINDLAESNAMIRVFGGNVPPFSSLKPFLGHTLGASEGVEAALVCRAVEDRDCSFMGMRGFSEAIPETGLVPYDGNGDIAPRNVMSSAFGFSGNCVSLIFSRL